MAAKKKAVKAVKKTVKKIVKARKRFKRFVIGEKGVTDKGRAFEVVANARGEKVQALISNKKVTFTRAGIRKGERLVRK